MRTTASFDIAIQGVENRLINSSYPVKAGRWQSSDVSDKPEMQMREIFNTSFQVPVDREDLDHWREDIKPNLPWADDHFEERVGGYPLNPGEQWKNWPWSLSADRFRTEGEKFSHTYMERYWPKEAGPEELHGTVNIGIRYEYGDLADVVAHLAQDPLSRQAFLPVWFPEDTGVVHRERVPCTLGYHFMMRYGYLHMTYYIRSCDFVRHFRDDLYLSVRLQLWMLDQLRKQDPTWNDCFPGFFVFHCASMHCFVNDFRKLTNEAET